MKLKIEQVYTIIKNALMSDDVINEDSNTENTEEWDSLGHLSILSALDKEFQQLKNDQSWRENMKHKTMERYNLHSIII